MILTLFIVPMRSVLYLEFLLKTFGFFWTSFQILKTLLHFFFKLIFLKMKMEKMCKNLFIKKSSNEIIEFISTFMHLCKQIFYTFFLYTLKN